jgi:hypothetical protein
MPKRPSRALRASRQRVAELEATVYKLRKELGVYTSLQMALREVIEQDVRDLVSQALEDARITLY